MNLFVVNSVVRFPRGFGACGKLFAKGAEYRNRAVEVSRPFPYDSGSWVRDAFFVHGSQRFRRFGARSLAKSRGQREGGTDE